MTVLCMFDFKEPQSVNAEYNSRLQLDIGNSRILASLKFDCLSIKFHLRRDSFVLGKVIN